MQLFITNFKTDGENIKIEDQDILNQIRTVLRMKIGNTIFVQKENNRYELEISDRDKSSLTGKIKDTIVFNGKKNKNEIAIAMPNKWDKIELLIQKISEIGIKHIYFRPSERSIIRKWNTKKNDRLNKIAKEAVEQSRGRFLPEIQFETNISKIIGGKNIIVFDKSENTTTKNLGFTKAKTGAIGIIGPEGGLTKNDYEKFGNNIKTVSLGNTVLRTETAGIIAARILKNN